MQVLSLRHFRVPINLTYLEQLALEKSLGTGLCSLTPRMVWEEPETKKMDLFSPQVKIIQNSLSF